AASILVAVISVGLQQSGHARARVACAENLTKTATAFQTYTSAFGGQLPVLAMPPDRNWLQSHEAGVAKSNRSNLLAMINGGYVQPANLLCAGVTNRAVATDGVPTDYSYAHVYNPAPLRPTWTKANAQVILTDKNPLFTDGAPVTVTA